VIDDENVFYSSDQRIDHFVSAVITLLGVVMIIAPLWILAFIRSISGRLGVITAFVVVFLCLISVTTTARPFESLAAAAA